jgi:hypothetical protein
MKTLLLVIATAVTLSAAPKCFEAYTDAASTIEKSHMKTQALYAKQSIKYMYSFEPVTMFPFFCIDKDTLEKNLILTSEVVYLCQNSITLRKFKDSSLISHVRIVILNYIQPVKGCPNSKTYTMYFLKQNKDNNWVEEKDPKVVTIKLGNRDNEEYLCK